MAVGKVSSVVKCACACQASWVCTCWAVWGNRFNVWERLRSSSAQSRPAFAAPLAPCYCSAARLDLSRHGQYDTGNRLSSLLNAFYSIITVTNVLSTLRRVQLDSAVLVPHEICHLMCSVPKGLALVSTNHDSCPVAYPLVSRLGYVKPPCTRDTPHPSHPMLSPLTNQRPVPGEECLSVPG